MHYSVTSIAFMTLVVAGAAGCGSGGSLSPTSPSAGSTTTISTPAQVSGTWTLTSVQPAGQMEVAVPGGASYELALSNDRVSTKVDCNVCGGSLSVDQQTMTVGPLLACTRAACATMAFESAYLAILAGESTTRIDGDTLTLTSARGALRFRR